MTRKEKWLRRLVRRLQLGLFLKWFVDGAVIFCLASGVLFLAVKLLWPQWWPSTQYLLLFSIPLASLAYWLSGRTMYSQVQTVAMLDQRIGADGLLMTLMEQPNEQWEACLPEAERDWERGIPPVRPVRMLKHLSIPLLFLIAAFVMPPRPASTLAEQPSAISQSQTEQLDELLKKLTEAEVLKDEDQAELEKEIEKLKQENEFSPLTHEDWAAVDAMREEMQVAAESRRNQMRQASDAATSAMEKMENGGDLSEREQSEIQQMIDKLCESGNESSGGDESSDGDGGSEGSSGKGGKSTKFSDKIARSKCKGKLQGNNGDLKEALDELSDLIEQECKKLDGL